MRKLLTSILVLLPLLVLGQTTPTQTENYVIQKVYQVPLQESEIPSASNDEKIESITYFDGLGRSKQSVAIRAGGNREDLITPVYYDDLGRQPKDYLPYPELNNNGTYSEDILTPLLGYYYNGYPNARHPYDINPYTENRFEASPLNRILETGAPGKDWKINPSSDTDHTVKMEYEANKAWEVRLFRVGFENGNSQTPKLLYGNDEKYAANQLLKTVTKDENWQPGDGHEHTTEEFKNKLGQIVLKRSFSSGTWENIDTYYIYDDFGNLTYVLSPETEANIINSGELVSNHQLVLNKLCYQYRYDYRNRLTEKKVPGKDWEYILYDNLDRPVLTQDANLRADNNKWLFTKYDALGRIAYTGIVTDPPARTVMEQNLRIPSTVSEKRVSTGAIVGDVTLYYTNWAFPTQDIEVLTINYYDDYIDYSGVAKPQVVLGANTTEHPNVPTTAKGLPTVSKVRVLGTTDWNTTLTGYDEKRRVLYVDSRNVYLDTRDIVKNKLDFTGKVLENETLHLKTGNATIVTKDYFYYDHQGRLLTHKQKIDSEPLQLIAENHYDELGQLIKKNVGGQTVLDGYTDITNAEITFDGTITKNESTNAWDSYVKTKGDIPSGDDGGISATMAQDNKRLRIGLLKSSSGLSTVEYFDYGIYTEFSNGQNFIKVVLGGTGSSGNYGTYAVGDILKVERVGTEVRFYKNTSLLETETGVSNDLLIGKAAFYDPNGSITDLNLIGAALDNKLQYVDYAYNIRGWLTDINDVDGTGSDKVSDLFGFKINYNLPIEGNAVNQGVVPLYNGNISQTTWKTLNEDTNKRSYGYKYDPLNRIITAASRKGNDLNSNDKYGLSGIWYDKNGNIKLLNRNGYLEGNTTQIGVPWDILTYTYNGNQLSYVEDGTTNTAKDEGFKNGHIGSQNDHDYTYDVNGNMTVDQNKNISITYNHLNLPEVVTQIDPVSQNTSKIQYVYDATGVKMEKNYTALVGGTIPGDVTQYAGNFIYQKNGVGDNILQFFNHPEGYVEPTPVGSTKSVKGFDTGSGQTTYSSYQYIFQYKDHLGNVRLSYADSDLNGAITDGEIIEESNYYPFGLKQKGYNYTVTGNGNALAQAFKFGGKELNSELSLEWYDFGARNYDASLGRWMSIDPLAEDMRRHSPYNYAFNNPIYFVDPDGMAPTDWYKNLETNEVTWMDGSKNYEGYENLGYYRTEIDVDGNVTAYNGDTKTKSYNGEVVESFETNGVESVTDFALDNIVSPIIEGAQTLGHLVSGMDDMVGELIDDVKNGGDGTSLRVDMEMPMYEFNNGNFVKTDLNEYSEGEIIGNGVSATLTPLNVINTGIKGAAGAVINESIEQGVGYQISNTVQEIADKEK